MKQALLVTFNQKRAPAFIKYVAEPEIMISGLQSLQFFWSHSSIFTLEK